MGTHTQRGFTIIELILVLGITGLLTVSLLVGVGTSVNQQRYSDAVQTLRSTLQTQYSELTGVRNGRSNNWSCDTATAGTVTGGAIVNRGQSNCIMLGRLITIKDKKMTTYSIIGSKLSEPALGATDIDELKTNYALNDTPALTSSIDLEWGTKIAWAKTGVDANVSTSRNISILLITAPTSGQLYTFTSDAEITNPMSANLKAMIVADATVPGRAQRVICVDPAGLDTGSKMGIYISSKASSANAIESRSNELLTGISKC